VKISTIGRDRFAIMVLAALAALLLSGCGYHLAGRGDSLPAVHVIAIPTLENKTTSYRIEQKLTSATVHEFLARTPYKVVSNPSAGDAVLRGKVVSLEVTPLLFDTRTSGRATTMLVTVKCDITLTHNETQRVLFRANDFLFRNEYEISTDVKTFFEEQDPALDRLAHDFATRLVAAIVENY